MTKEEVRVRVAESKQSDAGSGKARLSANVLNILNLKEGDVLEIRGKKITAATVCKSEPEDQSNDKIGIDGLTRRNAEITLNAYVTIRKADAKKAKSLLLASIAMNMRQDKKFEKFVKLRLL